MRDQKKDKATLLSNLIIIILSRKKHKNEKSPGNMIIMETIMELIKKKSPHPGKEQNLLRAFSAARFVLVSFHPLQTQYICPLSTNTDIHI